MPRHKHPAEKTMRPTGSIPRPAIGWAEGTVEAEKLVNMSKHKYQTEPNVTITPGGKWVVFRSNMHGPTHFYAAEVRKR
jgi:oligogalacturonide lyase